MSEPLRDTETIRAALEACLREQRPPDEGLLREVLDAVGRLQAAEQERNIAYDQKAYLHDALERVNARVVAFETALREIESMTLHGSPLWRIARAALSVSPAPSEDEDATLYCPRCGGETTEAELTYSGCADCQREAAESDAVSPAPSGCHKTDGEGLI